MTFREAVERHLGSLPDGVSVVEEATAFDPAFIRQGVVIFFASWSGPACRVLKDRVSQVQAMADPVPVWVLNQDSVTREVEVAFPGMKHGYGETYLFRDGRLVDFLLKPGTDHPEVFARKLEAAFRRPIPEPIAKDAGQIDEAQRQEYLEAAAREIATRCQPNRNWLRAGISVVVFGLFLIVATWSWKGGSMGRYGFHPTFLSCLVVFLGGLMIHRGRHGA